MGAHQPIFIHPQYGAQALLHLLAGCRSRLVLLELEAKDQQVAQQGVRQLLHLRAGPALEIPDLFGKLLQPILEFVQQAAFANPGIPDHGDELRAALLHGALKSGLQAAQLCIPPHHAGFNAF